MSSKVPNQSKARQSSGLSTSRMTSRQTGKMSGAQGVGQNASNSVLKSSGGPGRVGQNCGAFSSGYGSKKKSGPIS